MRNLIITKNMTLDGSIAMLDDWFDPQLQDPDLPQQTDDTTGVTAYLNGVQKYVVSSTITDPKWANSTVLNGDWRSEVHALKTRGGKDIVVTGSITLSHALIEAGLLLRYQPS